MEKSTISMAIFNSYFSLPEGTRLSCLGQKWGANSSAAKFQRARDSNVFPTYRWSKNTGGIHGVATTLCC